MEINQKIIQRYNTAGPRYTSYPPANVFRDDVTGADYLREVGKSNHEGPEGISLYVHVPFCPHLCFFCGCNSQKARSKDMIDRYFLALLKEIDRISDWIDGSRPVTQIHWGGGTPNSVDWQLVEMVMKRFRKHFHFMEDTEIAMECSPAYLDLEDLDRLSELGFNRLSLGIQDFNESVLRTINRRPSRLPVKTLVEYIQAKEISGINLDFIYGLPGQTQQSYLETLKKAVDIKPERLVTFSYAHVPWVKVNQKILEQYQIPGPEQKLEMLIKGHEYITTHGYESIGMDHFALPGDELVKAYHCGTLHRNFQGYCTLKHTGQVYAFGASGISQMHGSYFQNQKDAGDYIESIEKDELPVDKGYILNDQEKVIRRIINQLMCNGLVDFTREAQTLNMTGGALREMLGYTPGRFNKMKDDGLLWADEEMIRVSPLGMLLVRVIAKELDPNYSQYQKQFSKTI